MQLGNVANTSRTTVVVADGDSGARESLRMILEPRHRVLTAGDAGTLLDLLDRIPVSAVTLDLGLRGAPPGVLLRALRRQFPDIPVVLVTGEVCLDDAAEAVRCGVTDLIRKPFDVVQVAGAVTRAIAAQRQRSRMAAFLRSLGDLVGDERHVDSILREVEGSPRLRRQLSELVSRAAHAAAHHGEGSMAAPSAHSEGAW